MNWPIPSDYRDAIQNPRICFQDAELKAGNVALTKSGLPRVASGNFASVYEVRSGMRAWAVRCFLRQISDQQRRYNLLSQNLMGSYLPNLIEFQYLAKGILVNGQWHPILKMEWVDGKPLHIFVEQNLHDTNMLMQLASQWSKIVTDLRAINLAHGDLQHGNILVTAQGQIRLVDYDSMYLPCFRGDRSPELGHANYQHPRRTPSDYNEKLDDFASLVIYTSLLALSKDPSLWKQFHNDDNLILSSSDYKAPVMSGVLKHLKSSSGNDVRTLATELERCCLGSITQIPELGTVMSKVSRLQPTSIPIPITPQQNTTSTYSSPNQQTYITQPRQAQPQASTQRTWTTPQTVQKTPVSLTIGIQRNVWLWISISILLLIIAGFIIMYVVYNNYDRYYELFDTAVLIGLLNTGLIAGLVLSIKKTWKKHQVLKAAAPTTAPLRQPKPQATPQPPTVSSKKSRKLLVVYAVLIFILILYLLVFISIYLRSNTETGKVKVIIGFTDITQMVLIPTGEFQMGSNDGMPDEKPVHTVYLDAFYIDKYEVTNAQYKKFIDATSHKAPTYWNDTNYNALNNPVVGVSWYDAKAYADWAGKRLPTEAEWEKAARGGLVDKQYPWGDTITHDDANYDGTGGKDVWNGTSPVGSFAPNGYGLYDMAGNVWEWCSDWYDSNYYASSPRSNPAGPSSGSYCVVRGGSELTGTNYLHVSLRHYGVPSDTRRHVGFRCVHSVSK